MKRFLCWLIRWFGGSHQWRRLRRSDQFEPGQERFLRICNRCDVTRPVAPRTRKPKGVIA